MKNKLSGLKGSSIRNFASFFPNLPHPLEACLYREVPYMLPAKYQPNPPGGSGEEDF